MGRTPRWKSTTAGFAVPVRLTRLRLSERSAEPIPTIAHSPCRRPQRGPTSRVYFRCLIHLTYDKTLTAWPPASTNMYEITPNPEGAHR